MHVNIYQICQLCHQLELEEHNVFDCTIFYKIRGTYHCLFQKDFEPLCKVMEYETNNA